MTLHALRVALVREPWASALATLLWSVATFFAAGIRIHLPGTRSIATDFAQVALIGSAFALRRPWLLLFPAAAHAVNLFSDETLEIALQTTFMMNALSLPFVWYAHRALKRLQLDYLRLGLAWMFIVAIYYYALQLPLMMATNMVFLDYPWAKVGDAYVRVAEAFAYEVLLTAGVTTLAFIAKEEIQRRRAADRRLREALEAQRALVASAPVAVIATTRAGLVSAWNPAAERLFARSEAEASGAPPPRICDDPADERRASVIERVLAGETLPRTETQAQLSGGAPIPVAVSGAPLTDHDGDRVGAVLILEDLRAEQALRAAVERGERMSALGQLVGGVAHELRNPLFGITATLDAFGGQLVGHARLELMEKTLRGQVEQLTALMLDLLEYGKAGTGERAATSLALPMRLAIEDNAGEAGAMGIRVELALPPELPQVLVNPGQLHQVFRNLVHNAVAFSPRGGVVRIEGAVASDDRTQGTEGGPHVRIAVLDSGAGFMPADLDRVFEPFFTRRKGGTGLGLSLVQRIVEQHGGRVEAGNRPEGGARMVVELPAVLPSGA